MSLQRLKAALSTAEFTPHTLTLGGAIDLATVLPEPAREFISAAWPQGAKPADLLVAEPWGTETITAYRALETDDRLAVLASTGFLNHELAHRVDFLSTPYGVAFHGKACLESIGLLLDGAEVTSELQRREPNRPLRDIPPLADALVVSDGVEALNARVRWFDAQRGAAPKHLQAGWMGGPDTLSLANRELEIVMVHELIPTMLVPGGEGAYVRPLTVLESRAVALTGLLLLTRLGGDDFAAAEVARFLETFYSPREAFPDYRFLLDLFTDLWGAADLSALVEERGATGLTAILKSISMLGWYGLHATPETSSDTPLNASPMLRVVIAMQDLITLLRDGDKLVVADTFLDAVDNSDRAAELGFTGSQETLSYCIAYLTRIRRLNQETNPHTELREHFEAVFSIQCSQLERRLAGGYGFAAGIPEDGAVLGGLIASEADERLFFDEGPAEEVHNWFRLREMLLFRHARPPGFWPELWSALGTHPEATGLSAEDARDLALGRTRFVAGGIWPIESMVKTLADDKRLAVLPLRRSILAKSFAAAADTELTVESQWTVFRSAGDPLVSLWVSFAETGEEVLLLFSLARHRELIEAIAAERELALLSEDAYAALERGGEQHPETIAFPVTGSTEVLDSILGGVRADVALERDEQGWSAKVQGHGEELLDWAIEAHAWRSEGEAALFFAELRSDPPKLQMTLDGFPHPDEAYAQLLVAIGPAAEVRRFREERIPGTGAEIHHLDEAEALRRVSAVHCEVFKGLGDLGKAPFTIGVPKPLEVRLD